MDVEKAMFVKSIGNDSMQESTKKNLIKVSAMEKELRKLQADPEIKKEGPKSGTIEPDIKNQSILDIVGRPKSVGSNARYESALKALAKQQMLLGKVLNTKYTKEYGTTWKKDFKVPQQPEVNPHNALDACSGKDNNGELDINEDSDGETEEESSDSDTGKKTKSKSLLDGILTAPRSWSNGDRWEEVLNETSELKVHKIAPQTTDPRHDVVGEPPPVKGDIHMANPFPSPAESPDYIDIGPGYQHKELYDYMKQVVAELHLNFVKVKSMTGFCNLKPYEIHSTPRSCKKVIIDGESYIRVPTLFDPGSDGAAHT